MIGRWADARIDRPVHDVNGGIAHESKVDNGVPWDTMCHRVKGGSVTDVADCEVPGDYQIGNVIAPAVVRSGAPKHVPAIEVAADDVFGVSSLQKKLFQFIYGVIFIIAGLNVSGCEINVVASAVSYADYADVRIGVFGDP